MSSNSSFINLVECSAFAELFLRYPPKSFSCCLNAAGGPVFYTKFDLLTTLEENAYAKLGKFPGFKIWSAWLRFSTCFVGATITEYAPLPQGSTPEKLLQCIINEHARKQTLTIIKDLPDASPLLSRAENDFSAKLVEQAMKHGFIAVEGQALGYVDIDFSSVDEYLARLSKSRRKDLRRKMRKRDLLEIERLPIGDARFYDSDFLNELYAMYLQVFEQSEIHFDLLTPEFFTALLQSKDIEGVVVFYKHNAALVGYNLCMFNNNMLIDKFIGLKYPLARELNLYFISWLENLEFALQKGFKKYVTGWTDPQVKASLGAQFTFTRHLVWVKNPFLRCILYPLRHMFEADKNTIDNLK